MTKKLTTVILISNVIMGLLLFLSSQLVLYALNGKIVQGVGFFIDSGFSYYPIENAPPTITAPLPNLPLYLFIFDLFINTYFIMRLRKTQ